MIISYIGRTSNLLLYKIFTYSIYVRESIFTILRTKRRKFINLGTKPEADELFVIIVKK